MRSNPAHDAPPTGIRKTGRETRTERLHIYFDQLLAESQKLEIEFENEKNAHAAKERDITRLVSEHEELQSELNGFKDGYQSAQEALSRLECCNFWLEHDLKIVKGDLDCANLELSRNKVYKRERDNAIEKHDTLTQSYNSLYTRNLQFSGEMDTLKGEVSNLQTEKDTLLKRLAGRDSELEEACTHMKYALLRVKVSDRSSKDIPHSILMILPCEIECEASCTAADACRCSSRGL
jgi:hypothetical protein